MKLFTNESYNRKTNAFKNLEGRTHYYDESTMRFHGSSLVYATITDKGLLLATVEKYSVDIHHTKKAFRPVIFDIFGNVVNDRCKLEAGLKTKQKAIDLMWEQLNQINAKKVTREGIRNEQARMKRDVKALRDQLKGI